MFPPHYELTTQCCDGAHTTYGLSCLVNGRVSAQISDISCHSHFVTKMAELFNLCELPPERMKRAVIDLLP